MDRVIFHLEPSQGVGHQFLRYGGFFFPHSREVVQDMLQFDADGVVVINMHCGFFQLTQCGECVVPILIPPPLEHIPDNGLVDTSTLLAPLEVDVPCGLAPELNVNHRPFVEARECIELGDTPGRVAHENGVDLRVPFQLAGEPEVKEADKYAIAEPATTEDFQLLPPHILADFVAEVAAPNNDVSHAHTTHLTPRMVGVQGLLQQFKERSLTTVTDTRCQNAVDLESFCHLYVFLIV